MNNYTRIYPSIIRKDTGNTIYRINNY